MSYQDLGYNYLLGIDDSLDDKDGINTRNSDQLFEAGAVTFEYTAMNQLSPNQNMQSENFITGLQGWKIYGDGFAEFSGLTLTGGLLHYNKMSFLDSANSGYYISPQGIYFGDAGDATKLKFNIATGTLEFVGTVSGRDSATLASAINASGQATDIINHLVTELKLADSAVSSIKLQTGCVTELKIANDAVTAAKLNVAAINGITGDLVANSVGTTQITDDAVTSQKIVANAIIAGKIAANAVTAVTIEANAVTSDKIYAGAVTSDKIFAGAVIAGKIGALAIETNNLQAGCVVAAKIAAGTITTNELNANAINGMTITGATIQTAFSPAQAIVLNSSNITGYAAGGFTTSPLALEHKRMQLDYNTLEFFQDAGAGNSAKRTMTLDDSGITIWHPASVVNWYGNFSAGSATGAVIEGRDEIQLISQLGAAKGTNFYARNGTGTLYPLGKLSFDGTTTALELNIQASSRLEVGYIQLASNGYANFGSTVGTLGYGLRDNSGTMEYKNSGGAWTSFAASGLPAGVLLNHLYYTGFNWAATSTIYVGGNGGANLTMSSGRMTSSSDFVATGSLHATGNIYSGGVSGDDGAIYGQSLSTGNANMVIATPYHLYLRAGSAYNIYIGQSSSYRPTDINANFGNNFNFYQAGTIKAVLDNNFWTAGALYCKNTLNFDDGGQISTNGSRVTINKDTGVTGTLYATGSGEFASGRIRVGTTDFYVTADPDAPGKYYLRS